MNRRELLKFIAAATGCAFIGTGRVLAATISGSDMKFSAGDIAFFDEVAETILPKTKTPGAKEAKVGEFIAVYSSACYEPAQLQVLTEGIALLNAHMQKKFGTDFLRAGVKHQQTALIEIDRQAKEVAASSKDNPNLPPHYFTLIKQLTLLGFFTSEPGSTRVARYRPVPGKYKGCINYRKGDTFWA